MAFPKIGPRPELRRLLTIDIGTQGRRVMGRLAVTIARLGRLDSVIETAREFGRRRAGWRTMKVHPIALFAAACALSAELVAAAPGESPALQPRGATTYVAEALGRVIDVAEAGKGETETLVEVTGAPQSMLGESPFDKMRLHCLISFVTGGGKSSVAGACSETDGDGDILFTSFDNERGKLLGGTGKYAGMTGLAVFTVKPELSTEPGKLAYSVKREVTWALK